jgi:hypothetical protein
MMRPAAIGISGVSSSADRLATRFWRAGLPKSMGKAPSRFGLRTRHSRQGNIVTENSGANALVGATSVAMLRFGFLARLHQSSREFRSPT